MGNIAAFFTNIWTWSINLFSILLNWFLSLIATSIDNQLALIDAVCPDLSSYWASVEVITPYTSFINVFFPLQEASIFITAYFAFIFVFIPVKLIIKLFIPTVG